MKAECDTLDALLDSPGGSGEDEAAWVEHLAGCPRCREQHAAHAALREAFPAAPPLGAEGLEERVRQRLALPSRRPAAPRTLGRRERRLLAAYVAAATLASFFLLVRLPWGTEAATLVGLALGAAAVASPLLLLDRVGVVLPPGLR